MEIIILRLGNCKRETHAFKEYNTIIMIMHVVQVLVAIRHSLHLGIHCSCHSHHCGKCVIMHV